jgi:hypothetical protein
MPKFNWSVARDTKYGFVFLQVKTPKQTLEIRITPTGLIRVGRPEETVILRKGYRPLEEYEPRQRGMVAAARDAKKTKGTRQWKDGEITHIECPNGCGSCLRVNRETKKVPPMLTCPCGYEERAVK